MNSLKPTRTFFRYVAAAALAFASIQLGNAAQGQDQVDLAGQIFLRVNVGQFSQTKTGKSVIDGAFQVPFVQKQWNAIPKSLEFLKRIEIQSVTLSLESGDLEEHPLFDIRADFDAAKLTQVLSHAKQYALVESNGTKIHHWVTDFDELLGGESDESPDYVFLANPTKGRLLVSNSLARLTKSLDSESPNWPPELTASKIESNVLTLFIDADDSGLPGRLLLESRESDEGQLLLNAKLKGRNEAEIESLSELAMLVKNPNTILGMLNFPTPQDGQTEVEIGADEENVGKAAEPNGDLHQLSVSARLNRATYEAQDYKGMIRCFFKECVKSKFIDDTLSIDVGIFLGPCELTHVPGKLKGEDGKKVYNQISMVFDAYTSLKELQAGNRISTAKADAAGKATK